MNDFGIQYTALWSLNDEAYEISFRRLGMIGEMAMDATPELVKEYIRQLEEKLSYAKIVLEELSKNAAGEDLVIIDRDESEEVNDDRV